MSIYSTRKSKKQKNGSSGAPGPASASPWRAKRGTLPKLSTVLSQLKGDPLERKKLEKSLTMPKNERGTLWDFPTSILTQNSKKIEGGPFGKKIFPKKSLAVPKFERGDPLVSPGMVCYAEKRKTFLVQFARPNDAIWCNNIL